MEKRWAGSAWIRRSGDEEPATALAFGDVLDLAQQRNIEAGVLIHDRHFAGQLRHQFDGLVQSRQVRRLPGF